MTEPTADRPPFLERVGLRFLERRAALLSPGAGDRGAVHVLDPQERAELKRIETSAVLRAACAGALSATAAALADLGAAPLLGLDPAQATWDLKLSYWGVVAPVIVCASLGELSFLYWDALRSVDRLAKVAGLELSPDATDARRAEVATATEKLRHHEMNLQRLAIEETHLLDGVRVSTEDGWWLLRASNTEPVLSLRFEGVTEADAYAYRNLFFSVLRQFPEVESLQ